MKAVSGGLPTNDEGWAYEIKWDGMRVMSGVDGQAAAEPLRAVSGNGIDVAARFPELEGFAAHLAGHTAVFDGEVVAFDDAGRTDFARLQHRMHVAGRWEAERRAVITPVAYVVFDLLHLDGHDTTPLTYRDRRRLLADLVDPGPAWQVPAHHESDGAALLDAVTDQRLEGIVGKRLDSRYEPGRRSPSWRKVKVRRRQEMVVGGWTRGEGGRSGRLGALLVGCHDPAVPGAGEPDRLVFAGAVGSGFTGAELDRLHARMAPAATERCPFVTPVPAPVARLAQWLTPTMVVEVAFAEWTPEGRLRHPSYLGERIDRDPATVVREPT
jgi:bifunctional non-homologous end joining protein LigD